MRHYLVSFGSRAGLLALACGWSVSAPAAVQLAGADGGSDAPAAVHPCACCGLLLNHGGAGAASNPLAPFRIGNRWPGAQGSPFSLTWSVVPDGTTIATGNVAANPQTGNPAESADPSSVIAFLDNVIGAGPGGSDLTQRPWFPLFDSAYGRWDELSGLSMAFEPNDDGANANPNAAFNPGVAGVRGDMRIGGHSIDSQNSSNVLAYNFFPSAGEMVIDTDNTNFYGSPANNFRALRNVVMHEVGHGLGFNHLESNNSQQLMEPFISTAFDGPQFDDILAVQRSYGDRFEEAGGNDTLGTATGLGTFLTDGAASIGADASNSPVVAATDFDFISIDDDGDTDVFGFTLGEASVIDAVLTPYGPTYEEGPQDGVAGNGTPLVTSALSDLTLTLLDVSGVVQTANATGAGSVESLTAVTLAAGDYFLRITGAANNIQIYGLDLNVVVIPEPGTLMIAAGLSVGLLRRRRGRAA